MRPVVDRPDPFRPAADNEPKTICLDFFQDVWGRGNVDHIGRYLAEGFTFNAPPGHGSDRAGYAKMVQDVHLAFPQPFADVRTIVADEGLVASRWILEGEHRGMFMGIAPTHRKIRLEGMRMQTVKHGRIVSEYQVHDPTRILQQMEGGEGRQGIAGGPAEVRHRDRLVRR